MSKKTLVSNLITILYKGKKVALLLFLVVMIFLGFFLYQNIYKAITQNEEIVILQGQLALEPVDISLFRKILRLMGEKKSAPDINAEEMKNPFLMYNAAEKEE